MSLKNNEKDVHTLPLRPSIRGELRRFSYPPSVITNPSSYTIRNSKDELEKQTLPKGESQLSLSEIGLKQEVNKSSSARELIVVEYEELVHSLKIAVSKEQNTVSELQIVLTERDIQLNDVQLLISDLQKLLADRNRQILGIQQSADALKQELLERVHDVETQLYAERKESLCLKEELLELRNKIIFLEKLELRSNSETYHVSNNQILLEDQKDVSVTEDADRSSWKIVKYADGSFYEGYICRLGKRVGCGKYSSNCGDVYEGEWLDDKRQGEGVYTSMQGTYNGYWEDDKPSARGEYKWINGDSYLGDWCKGKMHGIGKFMTAYGDYYEGSWLDGYICGYGTYKWLNGESYCGEWLNGKKHGKGVYIYSFQDYTCSQLFQKYEGYFVNDKRHGIGNCNMNNNDKYEGNWVDDIISGQGRYSYANGDIFEGIFDKGKMTTDGIFHCATNGVIYSGFRLYYMHVTIPTRIKPLITQTSVNNCDSNDNIDITLRELNSIQNNVNSLTENTSSVISPRMRAVEDSEQPQSTPSEPILINTIDIEVFLTYIDKSTYIGKVDTDIHGNKIRHGLGVYKGKDGLHYDGNWLQNKFSGTGKCVFPNGDSYVGEWLDGYMCGTGKYDWSPSMEWAGCSYDGQFVKGQKSGLGKLTICANNLGGVCVYVGEFFDDKKHGQGVLTYADGISRHEGSWELDMKCGDGKYTSANGDIYECVFMNNKKNGLGMISYVNGDVYIGTWKADVKTGPGKFVSTNGDVYEGSACDGEIDPSFPSADQGQGDISSDTSTITPPTSAVLVPPLVDVLTEYIGEVSSDGKRQGYGKLIYKNGLEICEGFWLRDRLNGKGKYQWASGASYEGDFVGHERHGTGTYTYSPEEKYTGDWVHGKMSGKGVYISTHCKFEGEYRDNKRHGLGKYTFKNGDVYIGSWVDGKRHGCGRYINSFGRVEEVEYKNDRLVFFSWLRRYLACHQKRSGVHKLGTTSDDVAVRTSTALVPVTPLFGLSAFVVTTDSSTRAYATVPSAINTSTSGAGRQGRYVYANGDEYFGDWKEGSRHGVGKMIWKSATSKSGLSDVYEGDWCSDQIEGFGKYSWSNGDVYEGFWLQNKRNGQGKYITADGNSYEGTFANDQMFGSGRYIWKSTGMVYEGQYENNHKHGQGRITLSNGNIFEGTWVNGRQIGVGNFTFKNGEIYIGNLHQNIWRKIKT